MIRFIKEYWKFIFGYLLVISWFLFDISTAYHEHSNPGNLDPGVMKQAFKEAMVDAAHELQQEENDKGD